MFKVGDRVKVKSSNTSAFIKAGDIGTILGINFGFLGFVSAVFDSGVTIGVAEVDLEAETSTIPTPIAGGLFDAMAYLKGIDMPKAFIAPPACDCGGFKTYGSYASSFPFILVFEFMYKIIIIATLLTGCMHARHAEVVSIDPLAEDYYERFINTAREQSHPISIQDLIIGFTDSYNGSEVLGTCTLQADKTPTILLDKEFWSYSTDASKEQLVFHEMGHCILERDHVTADIVDKGVLIPKSIMDPYEFDDSIYLYHYDYYMHELFYGY